MGRSSNDKHAFEAFRKHAFEALDRTFRDILKVDLSLGNKV